MFIVIQVVIDFLVDFFGRMGLKRNLSAAEIVEQAVFARRLFSHEVGNITNVVFMVSVNWVISSLIELIMTLFEQLLLSNLLNDGLRFRVWWFSFDLDVWDHALKVLLIWSDVSCSNHIMVVVTDWSFLIIGDGRTASQHWECSKSCWHNGRRARSSIQSS